MSNLTTQQIIDAVDGKLAAGEDWEDIFENAKSGDEADGALVLKAAARFLESERPGASWSAQNFNNLIDYIAGGIWYSAKELGELRAEEDLEEGTLSQAAYDKIEAEDGWEAYSHGRPGQYIFPVEGTPGAIISFVELTDFDLLEADTEEF